MSHETEILASAVEDERKIFNSAINFALDVAGDDGLLFLKLWREGNWDSIRKEFPDYDIPVGLVIYKDAKESIAPLYKCRASNNRETGKELFDVYK